jgi:hypothetical protein
MKRALGAKNKSRFIDGSLPVPEIADLNRIPWERCNHLIFSWIINSVTPSIAQTLVFHEHALDVWHDLYERFSKADRIRIATLRSSINNLKQGSKSVLDYFTELRSLWEELNSHRPIPLCTCNHQCRCAAMRDARNHRLEDQIIQFLTGLNDNFAVVKTQILLMDPLPSINKVYSLVVQEESNTAFLVAPASESLSMVNASDARKGYGRGKPPSSGSKNSSRYCTFCDRPGHTVEFCYSKHGHPNVNKRQTPSANASQSENVDEKAPIVNTESASSSSNQTGISQAQYECNTLQFYFYFINQLLK